MKWPRSTTLNMVWLLEPNPFERSVSRLTESLIQVNDTEILSDDPCTKIHCGAGRVCQVQDDSAKCVCIPECPTENDPRRKVCTNRNETWGSDCDVHQQRCFCDTKDERCANGKNSHIHIEYYGECKTLQVNFEFPCHATFRHSVLGSNEHTNSPFVRDINFNRF